MSPETESSSVLLSASPEPVSPLRLLVRVNALQSWRRLRSITQESRLLSSFIGTFILGYLVLSFYLFYRGLKFVETFPGLGTLLTERLLYLLFALLFILLLLSNVVISYTNLFRNRETSFLLSFPISAQSIFGWKLIESSLLASWAFLFLISPLLAAYGLTHHLPWDFYFVTFFLIALFIVLPAVIGSWIAVSLARFMDRKAFQAALIACAIAGLAATIYWLKPDAVTDEMLETRVLAVLDRLLEKTRFSQFPFLPSYWLSAAVLSWAERALTTALFFALILLSYVLLAGFLAFTQMGAPFYEAFSTVQGRGSILARWSWFQKQKARKEPVNFDPTLFESALARLPLRSDTAALLVKDIRVFWRDTTQWGQTLVLFGLLGAYIINLRHFSQQLTNPFWVNLVSYLNLGASSLNLATLTTRFVYPQFSLEGKRLWIVGMAPLGMVRVVKTKYALATAASLAVTLSLIILSCHMLKLSLFATLYFAVAISIMTFTLNGLAIGLGTLYPNFREENPSKIVSGFGGTLCLVLSFIYILATLIVLAIGSPAGRPAQAHPALAFVSWLLFLALSLLLGWAPLKLGLRRLRTFEF